MSAAIAALQAHAWAWALFALYAVTTAWLAWKGGQKSSSKEGFAIGDGRMNPWVAGITLGACLASSATFVLAPGFVYKEGLPALIGFTLPFIAGLAAGFALFAPVFQRSGAHYGALTIPHWLGARYESPGLRRLFSALNILSVAYLVLITVGCGYVMQAALGVPYAGAVVFIVLFVFGYTGFGGTYAHAFTNALQGTLMLGVALLIFASGLEQWADGRVMGFLHAGGLTAPGSPMFSSHAEIWGVQFAMGVALTTQPHLLSKALYVEGRRALWTTVGLGMLAFALFNLVLFAGIYAANTLPAGLPQDQVMGKYLVAAFPWAPLSALVTVAILSASMSTLDGLLVAISASVGNDLVPGKGGVWANRAVLAGLAAITLALALSPPKLVLIFGQLGVYGLVASAAGPLVVGMFAPGRLSARWATVSALAALAVHFGLALSKITGNPGVSAAAALAVGLPLAAVGALRAPAVATAGEGR